MRKVSIRVRFLVLALLPVVALLGAIGAHVYFEYKDLKAQRLGELTRKVDLVMSLLDQEMERSGGDGAAILDHLQRIGKLRFGANDYFFVYEKTTPVVLDPKPELVGKDLANAQDKNGHRMIADFADQIAARGEAVVDYVWPKAGSDEPVAKLGYARLIPGTSFWIGTGVYIDELDQILWRSLTWALALTVLFAVILATISMRIARSVISPLARLRERMTTLAAGDITTAMPEMDARDEIGDLARSLAAIHANGQEALQIKLALDTADVSVMVADAENKIAYVNKQLLTMFGAAEAEIRQEMPSFRVDELVGQSIDCFHKNPQHQHAVLAQLSGTHRAEIKIGGRDLAFTANPVRDSQGQHLGTVVEWRDRTSELALQRAIDKVVAAAADGDFSKRIERADIDGVMARLADGINQVTKLVETATKDIGQMLGSLAEGDLTRRIDADYRGTLGTLKTNANRTADQLAQIVDQIQRATGEVKNAAFEISSGTEDLSRRTEQAASNLEETAASAEQMAATVRQNAENAVNANDLAGTADRSAENGHQVVDQAVKAMSLIEQSAGKITNIITVIDEIAFQTNLLALNASVEAARAGEAGKGFAVVAQEVRQLAQRSAQAATDIKGLIQESNGQVKEGVQLVNQAGDALAEILGSIGKVSGLVQQIANASQEQSAGVQEINSSINGMDEMTQQNSALVEESTAAARALSDQANSLSELMAFFKTHAASAQASPVNRSTERRSQSPASGGRDNGRQPAPAGGDDWASF